MTAVIRGAVLVMLRGAVVIGLAGIGRNCVIVVIPLYRHCRNLRAGHHRGVNGQCLKRQDECQQCDNRMPQKTLKLLPDAFHDDSVYSMVNAVATLAVATFVTPQVSQW